MGFSVFSTSSTYAMEKNGYENELNEALEKVLKERELYGEVSEESLTKLENILGEANLQTDSLVQTRASSGKWINIDKNWRYRVDGPHTGVDTAKYHVHVEGKIGNKKIESAEGVDGTVSHKKTMDKSGVPKWVQKKIKDSKKYKNGKKLQKDVKSAKAKIKAKKLNLKKAADIIIAIGIYVAIVGVCIFAINAVSAWGAVLIYI